MTKDLEDTIKELGPGYKEVVDRLLAPYANAESQIARFPTVTESEPSRLARISRYLLAASILIALAFGVIFMHPKTDYPIASSSSEDSVKLQEPNSYTLAYMGNSAKDEIIRTQNPDGSWENDFMTMQNAAALRVIDSTCIAYRKALRYLRSRGLSPITDAELRARSNILAHNSRKCL